MNKPEERCHWCGVPKRGDTGVYKEYQDYIFWFCCQEELDLWIEKYKVKAA